MKIFSFRAGFSYRIWTDYEVYKSVNVHNRARSLLLDCIVGLSEHSCELQYHFLHIGIRDTSILSVNKCKYIWQSWSGESNFSIM